MSEAQLAIKHGSGAVHDPRNSDDAPSPPHKKHITGDVLEANPAMAHGSHTVRSCSPLHQETPGSLGDLNTILSDDSLGLTPPKASSFFRRSASVGGRPPSRPPLTKRSASGSRKSRSTARSPSPAVLRKMLNVAAPVVAADSTTEARVQALERQVSDVHAFHMELT